MTRIRGLNHARIPGSVEEARTLVEYNQRIVDTSQSKQRRYRAAQMLVNLRPVLAQLERDELERLARIERATPPLTKHDEFDVVFSGLESLIGDRESKQE